MNLNNIWNFHEILWGKEGTNLEQKTSKSSNKTFILAFLCPGTHIFIANVNCFLFGFHWCGYFFQIWSLVNRCGEFLIQNLELDTCVDVLTLGDRSDVQTTFLNYFN